MQAFNFWHISTIVGYYYPNLDISKLSDVEYANLWAQAKFLMSMGLGKANF